LASGIDFGIDFGIGFGIDFGTKKVSLEVDAQHSK
jgi:hypothetical protein